MWNRKNLKQRGKEAFKANYWKCVLISLVFLLVSGFGTCISNLSGLTSTGAAGAVGETSIDAADDDLQEDVPYEDTVEEFNDDSSLSDHISDIASDDSDGDVMGVGVFVAIVIVAALVIILVSAALVALITFIIGPVEIGAKRFFIKNLEERAEIKEIGYGYDHGYMRNVVTLLFMDLYTFLWTLLFLIPGIIKGYEYSMIPYLMAEYPDMTRKELFAESKKLMTGNKWRAFVLDLSFLGWRILGVLTLGILNHFYVDPYFNQTKAAFYKAVCQEYGEKVNGSLTAV